jgi:hypothetical protein
LKQIFFENLGPNESIHVQFESRGCFHHSIVQLWFEKGASGAITIATSNQPGARPSTIELTPIDLKYLDLLMAWYRNNRKGSCTTVDTITVTKYRSGSPITSEKFIDESCELGRRIEIPTFLTFYARAGGK